MYRSLAPADLWRLTILLDSAFALEPPPATRDEAWMERARALLTAEAEPPAPVAEIRQVLVMPPPSPLAETLPLAAEEPARAGRARLWLLLLVLLPIMAGAAYLLTRPGPGDAPQEAPPALPAAALASPPSPPAEGASPTELPLPSAGIEAPSGPGAEDAAPGAPPFLALPGEPLPAPPVEAAPAMLMEGASRRGLPPAPLPGPGLRLVGPAAPLVPAPGEPPRAPPLPAVPSGLPSVPVAAMAPLPAPLPSPEPLPLLAARPLPEEPGGGPPPALAEAAPPGPVQRAEAPEAAPGPEPAPEGGLLEMLVRRGDALLALGDVSAARLFYERAAAAGSGAAALAMGRTHDPGILAGLGVRGLRADREAAAAWYRRALGMGEPEAEALLRRLEARPERR